jgi:hypothetical protein
MSAHGLPEFVEENYEVHEWKHAAAILRTDFPNEWAEIMQVLSEIRVRRSHVLVGGGGRSKITQSIDGAFYARGWEEKKWATRIVVDDVATDSPTHKVDCYKNRVAVEIEWSNKDPFFDRDLNNFRLLFDLRAISVGVIITKCDEYRAVFEGLGRKIWDKYGTSTTWMSKLIPRIEGGGGAGCPILVFGIRRSLYVEDD